MMTLIIGGSGSGKSAYAEKYIALCSEGKKKYYLATMQVYDKEGEKKVDSHRKFRDGKGFITIEQPVSIEKAVDKMDRGEKTALLECMSNLVANEMFSEEIPKTKEAVTDKIISNMKVLKEKLTHLIVVTNNVFEDGTSYDETTMEYIRGLANINEKLAVIADEVVEVVVGIPVVIKKGR